MEMRILGPLEVEGIDKPELGGQRQQSVLVLLALSQGAWVSRDRVVAGIWEEPPASAVSTLQGYVSHLRSALVGSPLSLESRSAEYALKGRDLVLDSQRFDAATGAARAALADGGQLAARSVLIELARALDLWRGPALEGFRDQPFAAPEASRLDALRLRAQIDQLGAAVTLGEPGLALTRLGALVQQNPFDEELRLLQILALYRSGRQVDALASYRAYRRQLAREMALEPGPRLRDLERAILKQDTRLFGTDWLAPGANKSAPGSSSATLGSPGLPTWTTSFVGRQADLERLESALGSRPMVTITGPGGCGKTRIAVEAGRRRPTAWGAAVFVDIGRLTDPARVVGVVAAAFQAEGPEVTAPQLARALAEEPALVILDGCEHHPSATAALCDSLLQGSTRLRILATSRQPLEVEGEGVFELPPMQLEQGPGAGPDPTSLADAVQLFLARAGVPLDPLPLDGQDLQLILAICMRLEGLPLAIELAAVTSRSLGLPDVLERLGSGISALGEGLELGGTGGNTVRAALDWSYRLLTPDQQLVFRRLGLFRGPFDLASVEALLAAGLAAREDVAGTLAQLVSRSLVARRPGPTVRGYALLEATREFSLERLQAAAEADQARAQHASLFLEFGLTAATALSGPAAPRWIAQLDLAEPDLFAALEELRDSGAWEDAARLELALATYALGRYRLEQIRARMIPLGSDPRLSPETRAEALRRQGQAEFLVDDFDAADASFAAGLELAQAAGLSVPRIRLLVRQAEVLRARNADPDQAIARLESLAGEAQALCESEPEIEARLLLAALHWDRGELAQARSQAQAGRQVAQRQGLVRQLADSQNLLSGVLRDQGELAAAEELLELAGAHFRAIDDPLESAHNEYSRARVALLRGDPHLARALGESSLRRFVLISEFWGVAMVERLLGESALSLGDPAAARRWLTSALARLEERGFASDIVAVLAALARVALSEGDFERAASTCQGALARLPPEGPSRYRAPLLSVLARAELGQGRHSLALATAQAAVAEAGQSGAATAVQEAQLALAAARAAGSGTAS